MNTPNYLEGGRRNQIIRIGDCVHRPIGPWTTQIHKFLYHLREKGFYSAPKPLGFDEDGREILSFIEGNVSNYPLSADACSISALISSAHLLRNFHEASTSFLAGFTSDEKLWQLPARQPQELICHGDFAPYNVVLNRDKAIGIIDFDTCHPGPRTWDIAYALYRWSPFTNPNNKDGFGTIDEQILRADLFCKAYGLSNEQRAEAANLIIERLQVLVDFLLTQAQKGNSDFELNRQEGHHLLYKADIDYIRHHLIKIENGLKN
ncbi:MAG: aminoglycoside phosphotransferase family protein [Tatlockia sp.]|nr:aminoglycoside phosphotransferase family protein [Tatlockia sp.]